MTKKYLNYLLKLLMKTNQQFVLFISFFLLSISIYSQQNYWTNTAFKGGTQGVSLKNLDSKNYQTYQLDLNVFNQKLEGAPSRGEISTKSSTTVSFPDENGDFKTFRIVEAPVLSPELALLYPDIKTYLGFSSDKSGARIRFSVTPLGVNVMMSYKDKPTSFLVPLTKTSLTLFKVETT